MFTRTCACMHCPACIARTKTAMATEARPPARPPATGGAAVQPGWTPPRR